LRRGAGLRVEGLGAISDALWDPRVSALLRAIGARAKRLRSEKRPLLWAECSAFVERGLLLDSEHGVRDAFAVVLAFCFATRVSELVALKVDDLSVVALTDGRSALRVSFLNTKTRQTLFGSHQPFVCASANILLLRAYQSFRVHFPSAPAGFPLLPRLSGDRQQPLTRDWFAKVIRGIAPSAVPHSVRVGAATEMWAAGVPLSRIMAVGRWTSTAALLYVIGSLEGQVAATDALGNGALSFRSDSLHQQLGASAAAPTPEEGAFDERCWLSAVAAAAAVTAGSSDDE
jgi:integrase